MSIILVTGGTGFVGGHMVAGLLKAGHEVRTSVRNLQRKVELLSMLEQAGVTNHAGLTVDAADLESDTGWAQMIKGCEFVHHVASPFPSQQPKDEQQVIRPAVEGTLRILRFSRDAGVRRVIMTSSFAAIGYGHALRPGQVFSESDWTNLEAPLAPYIKSKTLAEQAAWSFIREEGGGMEFTAINPSGIFGPVLGPDYSSSVGLIQQMLDGEMPMVPRISFGVVDVRDVVDIPIRAMTYSVAAGERFIAVSGPPVSMLEVARILRSTLGDAASKVPTKQAPDWLLRTMALFSARARQVLPDLGRLRSASNKKARTVLGWAPRSATDAVLATAHSLLELPPCLG